MAKDPLEGVRLDHMLEAMLEYFNGFDGLSEQINIRCFTHDPSINSSLKFLRKTPWARTKVEQLYLFMLRQQARDQKKQQG